jgi:hypothetical protein
VFWRDNDSRSSRKSLQKCREHWHRYRKMVPRTTESTFEEPFRAVFPLRASKSALEELVVSELSSNSPPFIEFDSSLCLLQELATGTYQSWRRWI